MLLLLFSKGNAHSFTVDTRTNLTTDSTVPEIRVQVTDKFDPKSLPKNLSAPCEHPFFFTENEMDFVLRSVYYAERSHERGVFTEPQSVFPREVLGSGLPEKLREAFLQAKKNELIFFQVWGKKYKTTGVVFIAGERIYWKFGLINGLPFESSISSNGLEKDPAPPLNWQLVSGDGQNVYASPRSLVVDLDYFKIGRPGSSRSGDNVAMAQNPGNGGAQIEPGSRHVSEGLRWQKSYKASSSDSAAAKTKGPDSLEVSHPSVDVVYFKKQEMDNTHSDYGFRMVSEGLLWRKKPLAPQEELKMAQSHIRVEEPSKKPEEMLLAKVEAVIPMSSKSGQGVETDSGEAAMKPGNALLAEYYAIRKLRKEEAITDAEYRTRRRELILRKGAASAEETKFASYVKEKDTSRDEFHAEFKGVYKEDVPDRFEGFNRAMYGLNDFIYEKALEPVATVYTDVTDDDLRGIVKNFFRNLGAPVRLVSTLLQGEGGKAGRVLASFFINTALTGGLVDVAATEFHIDRVDANFDQVLKKWGMGTGSYFVWPISGPATARSTIGMLVDKMLNPFWFVGYGAQPSTIGSGGEKINDTALNLGFKKDIDDMAIDPYLSVRDFYLQKTQGKTEE
jgi:phospholipid-binding lipoprotein MlaA